MKLICYITLGNPTIAQSKQLIEHYVAAGCDTVEIDLPTRNPLYVNDFIRNGMNTALDSCADYNEYLAAVADIHKNYPQTSIIFTLFENIIMEVGPAKMLEFCKTNAEAIVYVGEEHPEVRQQFMDAGVKVSSFIRYHMPEDEIEAAMQTNGFIYLQAKPDGEVKPGCQTLKDCIAYLRSRGLTRPIYCGMGMYAPEDVKMVRESGGDGAFAGSVILKLHDRPQELIQTIRAFKAQTIE